MTIDIAWTNRFYLARLSISTLSDTFHCCCIFINRLLMYCPCFPTITISSFIIPLYEPAVCCIWLTTKLIWFNYTTWRFLVTTWSEYIIFRFPIIFIFTYLFIFFKAIFIETLCCLPRIRIFTRIGECICDPDNNQNN